jgi:hypothetical protein
MRYITIPYFAEKYNFVKVVEDLFETNRLQDLNETHAEQFKVGMDSSTSFHEKFYNKYREGWPEMETLYEKFIEDIISPLYNEDFLYQKFPTVRFHLPNHVAVGAFHTDAEFFHPEGEMNYIIPLTNSNDTASVWVESEPGKEDFFPIPLQVGQLVKFNGNELTHGNKINETKFTRVSMDFRILPCSKYNEDNGGESMTLKTKFKVGEYYKIYKQPKL